MNIHESLSECLKLLDIIDESSAKLEDIYVSIWDDLSLKVESFLHLDIPYKPKEYYRMLFISKNSGELPNSFKPIDEFLTIVTQLKTLRDVLVYCDFDRKVQYNYNSQCIEVSGSSMHRGEFQHLSALVPIWFCELDIEAITDKLSAMNIKFNLLVKNAESLNKIDRNEQ